MNRGDVWLPLGVTLGSAGAPPSSTWGMLVATFATLETPRTDVPRGPSRPALHQ